MSDPHRLAAARDLILQVLAGEVDYDSHPEVFDDDCFYLAVWLVEQEDPGWLRARSEDPLWPRERRESAAGCLGLTLEEACRALSDPGETPGPPGQAQPS